MNNMSAKSTGFGFNPTDELNDLRMSKESQPLFDAVKKHIAENVEPIAEEFYRLGEEQKRTNRWSWHPRQLELLECD